MSEEAAEVEVEVEAEPEYSPYELEAMDAGWKPEGKDKDGNSLSAQEYMARKPLFNKIHNLNDRIGELENMVKSVQGDSKKMAQAFIKEKADLQTQLKAQREQALTDLDTDKVRELDKQIEQVNEVTQAQAYSESDWNKGYMSFLKENAWYDQYAGMAKAADIIGKDYMRGNPQASPDDLYSHVATEIKKEFPDRFEEKKTHSKVTSSNKRPANGNQKTKVKLSDFDEETQKVYKVMANAVGKTIEEYLNP